MIKSPDAFRTISEVSEWLDRPTHVLRFWESKFPQIKPVKRAGGRRYYRPQDMLLLGGIKRLLHDDGMTIKGVQKMLREQGIAQVAALSQPLEDADLVAALGQPDPGGAAQSRVPVSAGQVTEDSVSDGPASEAPMTLMAEDSPSADSGAQVLPFRDPSRELARDTGRDTSRDTARAASDAPASPRAPMDLTAAELAATMPADDAADDLEQDTADDFGPDTAANMSADAAGSFAAPDADSDQPLLPFDAPPKPRTPTPAAPRAVAPRAMVQPSAQPALLAPDPAAAPAPTTPPPGAPARLGPDMLARLAALTQSGGNAERPLLTPATRRALVPLTRRLVAVAERMRATPPRDDA